MVGVLQLYCAGCSYGYKKPCFLLVQCGRGEEQCPCEQDTADYRASWLQDDNEEVV